jgi:squalene cyclase
MAVQSICPNAQDEIDLAKQFLARHQLPSLGFSTYQDPRRLQLYMGLDRDADVGGWCTTAHICNTAYAILALAAGEVDRKPSAFSRTVFSALDFLRETQEPCGNWKSYWWRTPMYATVGAMRALHSLGDSTDKQQIDLALKGIVDAQRPDGG